MLIIEDSQDLQFLLGRLFQKAGYTLSQAYDGQQALDMLISMCAKQLDVTYFFPKPIRSIDSLLEVAAKLTMSD